VAVGSPLGSRVGSMVGDGGGVNGNEGVGTAVGVGEEARSSVPESCGRIPNPYNPPTTAPTMAKTNTRISNLEGPAYSGCVSSIRQNHTPRSYAKIIRQETAVSYYLWQTEGESSTIQDLRLSVIDERVGLLQHLKAGKNHTQEQVAAFGGHGVRQFRREADQNMNNFQDLAAPGAKFLG